MCLRANPTSPSTLHTRPDPEGPDQAVLADEPATAGLMVIVPHSRATRPEDERSGNQVNEPAHHHNRGSRRATKLLRKEVIQPHLPVRLPCYDLVLITSPTFDGSPHKGWATGFGCYRLS